MYTHSVYTLLVAEIGSWGCWVARPCWAPAAAPAGRLQSSTLRWSAALTRMGARRVAATADPMTRRQRRTSQAQHGRLPQWAARGLRLVSSALVATLLAPHGLAQVPATCEDGLLTPATPAGDAEIAIDCGGPCGPCVCASLLVGETLPDGTTSDGEPPDHGFLVQTCHTPSDVNCYDGDTATYSCYPGYIINETVTSNTVRTCHADSGEQWDGVAAACMGIECGEPPPVRFGSFVVRSVDTIASFRIPGRYPSRVDYTCDPGYTRLGSSMQTCNTHGQWAGMPWIPVECVGDPCDDLAAPTNMKPLNITNGGRYPANAIYECLPGYELIGAAVRSCGTDGSWGGQAPSCRGIVCDSLPAVDGGLRMATNGGVFPSTAVYSCDAGLERDGQRTRQCEPDGSWSPAAPLCGEPCTSGFTIPHSQTTCPWGVNARV